MLAAHRGKWLFSGLSFTLFSNLFQSGWFVSRVLLSWAPGGVCAPSCIPGGCVFACLWVGVLIYFENVRIEYWCIDGAERHVFTFQFFLSLTHWTLSILSICSLTCPWAHANANRKPTVFVWWSPLICGLRFSWRLLTAVTVEDYGRVHFKL